MSKNQNDNNLSDDFDTKEIIRNIEDHTKEMFSLTQRVEKLEEKFGNNEKIAETLSDTAQKAVKMQTMFADTFVKLLEENDKIKTKIVEIINRTDRSYISLFIKRFGLLAWTVCVAIVSPMTVALINRFIGKS